MRGSGAGEWLQEQAELAEGLGDSEAAKAWRDIAAAADAILLSRLN
jgi:NAD(P)H-dependent FMN reductase